MKYVILNKRCFSLLIFNKLARFRSAQYNFNLPFYHSEYTYYWHTHLFITTVNICDQHFLIRFIILYRHFYLTLKLNIPLAHQFPCKQCQMVTVRRISCFRSTLTLFADQLQTVFERWCMSECECNKGKSIRFTFQLNSLQFCNLTYSFLVMFASALNLFNRFDLLVILQEETTIKCHFYWSSSFLD